MSDPEKIREVALIGQPMSAVAAQALQMSRRGERMEAVFKGPMAKKARDDSEREARTIAVDKIVRGKRNNLGAAGNVAGVDVDDYDKEAAALTLVRARADEAERLAFATSLDLYKQTALEQVERDVEAEKVSMLSDVEAEKVSMLEAGRVTAAEILAAEQAERDAERGAQLEGKADPEPELEETTPEETPLEVLSGAVDALGETVASEPVEDTPTPEPKPDAPVAVSAADLPDGWRDDHWATRKALGDRLAGKDFEDLAAAMVFLNSLEAGE